ncbi:MFS transporter [Phenylobacterium sp.]|uniref:MFS transporter n=1 Tax=Phenylobacterium sp. TaxID=1871053 RepID=UPI0027342F18|nr:MFS transporter [Phenylobacterium sp.]MDP3855839.1 MFS transporter [Phenylobacterium sp.]
MSSAQKAPVGAIAVALFGAVFSSIFAGAAAQSMAEIGGGLSAAARDASWFLTLYDLGQVMGLPLVWILGRGLGRGRAMALAGFGYALTSAGVALAPDLVGALPLRVVHGVFGGMLPVFMMLMVMSSLRPGQGQAEGLAAYALSATVGAGFSAAVAAGLLEFGGWRALFWVPAAFGFAYAVLASRTLVAEKGQVETLRLADWPSYALLTAGLGALVVAFSEGERRFWLETWWITALLLAGAVGLGFAIQSLRASKSPLIRMSIFLKPTFTWSILVAMMFRGPVLIATWVAPQYLVRTQGYSIAEIGESQLVIGLATLAAIPAAYGFTRFCDPRWPLSLGLGLSATGAWICTGLAPDWAADQLRIVAVLTGVGQALVVTPVLRYAVHGIEAVDGMSCGLLFNLSRLLGHVLATAGLAHLIAQREKLHWERLGEALVLSDPEVGERLTAMVQGVGHWVADPAAASGVAVSGLARQLSVQAHGLALIDAFRALAGLSLLAIVLTWALPVLAPTPPGRPSPRMSGKPS